MAIRSAKDIREQLHDTCCKCKQVREKAQTQRVLRDAIEADSNRAPVQINPSTSFHAIPTPR